MKSICQKLTNKRCTTNELSVGKKLFCRVEVSYKISFNAGLNALTSWLKVYSYREEHCITYSFYI